MSAYSSILYIHVIATLGLVGAISVEAIAVRQLGRVSETAEGRASVGLLRRVRVAGSICLLLLFLSGGYLTDRLGMWTLAWPKVAVFIVVAFGALAGISGRRLDHIQKALRARDGGRVPGNVTAPFLKMSLNLRIGLVLAAVFLMVFKPNFVQSVGAVLGFVLIFLGAGSIGPARTAQDYTAARNLESSPR